MQNNSNYMGAYSSRNRFGGGDRCYGQGKYSVECENKGENKEGTLRFNQGQGNTNYGNGNSKPQFWHQHIKSINNNNFLNNPFQTNPTQHHSINNTMQQQYCDSWSIQKRGINRHQFNGNGQKPSLCRVNQQRQNMGGFQNINTFNQGNNGQFNLNNKYQQAGNNWLQRTNNGQCMRNNQHNQQQSKNWNQQSQNNPFINSFGNNMFRCGLGNNRDRFTVNQQYKNFNSSCDREKSTRGLRTSDSHRKQCRRRPLTIVQSRNKQIKKKVCAYNLINKKYDYSLQQLRLAYLRLKQSFNCPNSDINQNNNSHFNQNIGFNPSTSQQNGRFINHNNSPFNVINRNVCLNNNSGQKNGNFRSNHCISNNNMTGLNSPNNALSVNNYSANSVNANTTNENQLINPNNLSAYSNNITQTLQNNSSMPNFQQQVQNHPQNNLGNQLNGVNSWGNNCITNIPHNINIERINNQSKIHYQSHFEYNLNKLSNSMMTLGNLNNVNNTNDQQSKITNGIYPLIRDHMTWQNHHNYHPRLITQNTLTQSHNLTDNKSNSDLWALLNQSLNYDPSADFQTNFEKQLLNLLANNDQKCKFRGQEESESSKGNQEFDKNKLNQIEEDMSPEEYLERLEREQREPKTRGKHILTSKNRQFNVNKDDEDDKKSYNMIWIPRNRANTVDDELLKMKQIKLPVAQCEKPDLGDFIVDPPLCSLQKFTIEQIKNISNVSIKNEFGKVTFLDPISLYKKTLNNCIIIQKNCIQIIDQEWKDNKRCEMLFNNFANYKDHKNEQKHQIQKKMREQAEKMGITIKAFSYITGDLTVRVIIRPDNILQWV